MLKYECWNINVEVWMLKYQCWSMNVEVSLKYIKVNYEIIDKVYYHGPSWINDEFEKMMGPFCEIEYWKC